MPRPTLKTDPLGHLKTAQTAIFKLIDRTRFLDPDGASKAREEAKAALLACLKAVEAA